MDLKNIKHKKEFGVIGLVILLLGALFSMYSDTPSNPPGFYPSGSQETSLVFNETSASDDTYYEISNSSSLSGTLRNIKSFTILAEVHSSKTPVDYDATYCGLYWNTSLIGYVSQFNNFVVDFDTNMFKSGTNLNVKCFNLGNSGSDTVYVDLVYVYR